MDFKDMTVGEFARESVRSFPLQEAAAQPLSPALMEPLLYQWFPEKPFRIINIRM